MTGRRCRRAGPGPWPASWPQRLGVDLEFHRVPSRSCPGSGSWNLPIPGGNGWSAWSWALLTAGLRARGALAGGAGPSLGRKPAPSYLAGPAQGHPAATAASLRPRPIRCWAKLLPEAPLNEQGILVSLRAMDTCEVRIEPQPDAGPASGAHPAGL